MKVTTLSHDYSSVFTGFLSYLSAGQLSNTVFLSDDRTHCAHGKRHTKCTNCKHSTLGTVSIYYSIQTVHNVYIERNVPFLNTVNIVHNVQGVHTLQIKNTVQWYCPLLDLLIWASGLIVGAKVALYLWTPSLSLYCTTCCITILVYHCFHPWYPQLPTFGWELKRFYYKTRFLTHQSGIKEIRVIRGAPVLLGWTQRETI